MENEQQNNGPKNDKENKPKRSFNFYWIYGIIIVVILSIQLLSMGGGQVKIDQAQYDEFVQKGDVDRVIVVNKEVAQVFIKRDRLDKEPHKSKIPHNVMSGSNVAGPHYRFNIGPAEHFQAKLERDLEQHAVNYSYETQDNWGREILQWVLFLGVMIVVWMFVMRRIGGGGGPGGQIFNIGKSRAQVFEGGKSTNVTFNDVAGLDEAKEELEEIVDFLKNPKTYTDWAPRSPREPCW